MNSAVTATNGHCTGCPALIQHGGTSSTWCQVSSPVLKLPLKKFLPRRVNCLALGLEHWPYASQSWCLLCLSKGDILWIIGTQGNDNFLSWNHLKDSRNSLLSLLFFCALSSAISTRSKNSSTSFLSVISRHAAVDCYTVLTVPLFKTVTCNRFHYFRASLST